MDEIIKELTKKVETLELLIQANARQVAYGQAYRTALYTMAVANTWYDLDLNGGNNNLLNIYHSTADNPDRMTILSPGDYSISYNVQFVSTAAPSQRYTTRVRVNDITELKGSAFSNNPSSNTSRLTCVKFLASFLAGDFITLQVGTDSAGEVVNAGYGGPAATTYIAALMIIKRIG